MIIWTDASFKSGKAGLSAQMSWRDPQGAVIRASVTKSLHCEDNNIAELEAIKMGLVAAPAGNIEPLYIVTDSNVAISVIEGYHKGKQYQSLRKEILGLLEGKDYKIYSHRKREDRGIRLADKTAGQIRKQASR